MKVIIAGSRNFKDKALLYEKMDELLTITNISCVVSGTANGADKLGEKWANERGITIKRFPADWDTYGKSAGYRRNEEMAIYADGLVAFWDGKSKGTKHMIDLAEKHGLTFSIVGF